MEQNTQVMSLVEQLSNMKILEVAELVKTLEEQWGVSAAAPVVMGAAPAAVAAEEEQTEFKVVLKDAGASKINVIKEIRAITGLGLKEAKDLSDAGGNVKEGISKKDATEIAEKLKAAGAQVVVQ